MWPMRAPPRPPYRRAMSNTQTVRDIYAAFGRGDIPAILERLADDVCWDHLPDGSGAARHEVPWLVARTGRDDVAGFFAALGALEFHVFPPTAILGGGAPLLALIDEDVGGRATRERLPAAPPHPWGLAPPGPGDA